MKMNLCVTTETMKVVKLLMILVLLTSWLWLGSANPDSNIEVTVKGTNQCTSIPIEKIDNKSYVEIDRLASALKANVKEERNDKRIYLNAFDEQFIFLAQTSYFSFNNQNYKLAYPVIIQKGKEYIPVGFALNSLPALFKDKIKLTGNKLTISVPQDYTIKTIVLDPGHGGRDPGAVSKGNKILEKDLNLNVAFKLKALLEKELNVRVLLTRSEDKFVSLEERTKFANASKADLFVSIHTNASKDRSSHGTEMYYLSTAKTTEARAVEALENSVVEIYEGGKDAGRKYDDLALTLSDILQAENLEQSNNLALKLQMNIVAGTKSQDRGVRQANFYVLRGAFMPAVLIEMGFISNAQEVTYLNDNQYQERMARTIFEGLKSFKYRYDRIRSI